MGEGLRTMKSQDGIEKIIVFDCCKLVTAQETNKLDKEISSASYILCYCCWLLAISNLTSNSFFFFFHSSEMWRLRSTKCFKRFHFLFYGNFTLSLLNVLVCLVIKQIGKCNVAWNKKNWNISLSINLSFLKSDSPSSSWGRGNVQKIGAIHLLKSSLVVLG